MNARALIGFLVLATIAARAGAQSPAPVDIRPVGQEWTLVKNWTFGNKRPDATIRDKAELDREFYYRYIYDGGTLDILPTYWSYHRDYPEGDPKSLHVFGPDTLTLKGRIPPGGGLKKRGIETGMLRSKFSVGPGMYMEMRAKLPQGVGAWPAFWLGCGEQYPDGTFSKLPWPPEIDIFEFFNWNGRPLSKALSVNVHSNKKPEQFGNPHVLFTRTNGHHEYEPGCDFGAEFHVFALDWRKNEPVWYLDGIPIHQAYYEWNGPPAHLLMTNQLGIGWADCSEMVADEKNWDYVIDYIRVWERKTPGNAAPAQPDKP